MSELARVCLTPAARDIVWPVRLFLALWLAVFAVQTTELLTVVAPDGCTESSGGAADACRDGCLRCVCCARVSVFVTQSPAPPTSPGLAVTLASTRVRSVADPGPRAVFHVPKTSLA